jgi:hypothetical protein
MLLTPLNDLQSDTAVSFSVYSRHNTVVEDVCSVCPARVMFTFYSQLLYLYIGSTI